MSCGARSGTLNFRLRREAGSVWSANWGGAAPELRAPETAAPRGSVWRIYWPRIAAAAAVVLLGVVAGDYMLRPDKALENDGNVIASTVEEAATAVTMPQPHAAESVREALAQAVGLADGQAAAPPVQQPGAARRSGEARGENGDGDCDGTDGRCRNDRRNFRRRGCRPALCEANGGGDFAAGGGNDGKSGGEALRDPFDGRSVGADGVL